ncbi:MAG: AAA family ATPase [Chloroflexi bacterium]|nr:AAA family ATPase [Chloroflexota bacterium]
MSPQELTADQLRRHCDPAQFAFVSTADAPDLEGIIGQERAERAIEFGIEMPHAGYNIYAMGPVGAGKTSIITRFLQRKAATRPIPSDWGYIHNLADTDRPVALRLPPGGGVKLRGQVDALLAQVAEALPKSFASDQYAEHRNALGRELDQQRNERSRELDRYVHGQGFDLSRTPAGVMVVPLADGKPMTEEQFNALSEAEQDVFNQHGQAVQEVLDRVMRQVQELEEAAQERLAHLDQEIAAATISPFFEKLTAEYRDWPDVVAYLQGAQAHVAANTDDFKSGVSEKQSDGEGGAGNGENAPWFLRGQAVSPYDRYRLNVIVDNQGLTGAPVVEETNPTYGNLIGRVEMRAEFGTLVTDFRRIKAGALHRANGGYLVLDAKVLLRQPLAWESLKQALRSRRIRIEDVGQQMGALATATLTPEAIPLDVKVVLIGDPATYYLLYAYDEQFEKIFKVRADFAEEMAWSDENVQKIAQFIRSRCVEEGLPHFDVSAVSRVIEYSGRQVEDQRKLTARFAHVDDIVQEAAFWAGRTGHAIVTADDVTKAIDERVYRSNQFEERLRELTTDGTLMVDTAGAVVGQVNGLAVLELGDYAFGRPSRITCQTFQGRAGVINIEREAKLSGHIHDKGMLILAGFLGGRYAQDKPLTLSASIAFEQSYEGVDGDSASSTELYALLSSLAGLPLNQAIAVTGSVNQRGEIQAIGGATLKIEGFFDVCRAMPGGLTGKQGVILPAANVSNLMLRDDVVAAVAEGGFHIYSVRTVDEGIELLTGLPAGARGPNGAYPEDTVNGKVDRRLSILAEQGKENGGKRNGNGRKEAEAEAEVESSEPGEPELPGEQPEPADS